MPFKLETRTATLEVRAGAAFEVTGRALSYNKLSKDLGGFQERILPGAFKRSLASPDTDVKCLINHDSNQILGRLANKTLRLADSNDGLDFVCKLNPKSQAHKDFYASVQRQDLSECSFAFGVDDGGDSFESITDPSFAGRSITRRTIRSAQLFDVSIVANPAYGNGATNVSARQLRSADYGAAALPKFVHQVFHTRMPRTVIDQRNRERLNAITRTIVTDSYSNALIEDFELRAKADRIANIIERDDWNETFAQLRRELGE
jgi:Escherichia/Staphylococcus phage prohead protease